MSLGEKDEEFMLTSLGYIFLVGLALGGICRKLGLPRIVGMLFTGAVLGLYGKFLSREKP